MVSSSAFHDEMGLEYLGIDLADHQAVGVGASVMESVLLTHPADPDEDISRFIGSHVIAATNSIYERYETNLELSFAQDVLAGDAQIEDYPMYDRFRRLISREVELARIGPLTGVVFIGSGPFPISSILIHQFSGGAKVECLDMSEEACQVSEKVVKKLGLENRITIKQIVAQEAELPSVSKPGDIGRNSVAVVALLAQPKPDIVDRIVLSMSPMDTIVMRNSEGNRRLFYKGIDQDTIIERSFSQKPGFDILEEYHAGPDDTISGVVMKQRYTPWVHRI